MCEAVTLLLALLVPTLLLPPTAEACGGTHVKAARKNVNPGGKAPLAIGDSVMLLALPDLAKAGFRVDARGCRMWAEGADVVRSYKRRGKLPHLVVMALGADWIITKSDIRKVLRMLGPKRVLGLVVPRELGGGTSRDARVVRKAWRAHTRRIVLLDWVRYSEGKGSWFQPDGLHLTFPGAAAYARLIAKATPYARAGAFPSRARFPR